MEERKKPALIMLFVLGVALLNFPFVGLPEKVAGAANFPVLPFYLLLVWLLVVGGIFLLNRKKS